MPLQSVLGLGGGLSNTSVTSKTEQTIESFVTTATGQLLDYTTPENYRVLVWTGPGTFTVEVGSREVDMFIMGGGGAGGSALPSFDSFNGLPLNVWGTGGGGGGGGYNQKINYLLSADTYEITVGAGGAGPQNPPGSGDPESNGGDSSFGTIISATGGEQGSFSPRASNRGDSRSGIAIVNGNESSVPGYNAVSGNTVGRPDPSYPINYFLLPAPGNHSSDPQEVIDAEHLYVVGGAGAAAGYRDSSGNLQPGKPLPLQPYPRSTSPIQSYQPVLGMDGTRGFPAPGVIFGGWPPSVNGLPTPFGTYWGSGGGGGANVEPASIPPPLLDNEFGGDGGDGAGNGGGAGRSLSGQSATSIGSGGGGAGVEKRSLTSSIRGGKGNGHHGICIVRYINRFY